MNLIGCNIDLAKQYYDKHIENNEKRAFIYKIINNNKIISTKNISYCIEIDEIKISDNNVSDAYNLYKNNIINNNNKSYEYYFLVSIYNVVIKSDFNKAIEYCSMAIKNNNDIYMCYLAIFYCKIGDYVNCIKYFKLAIDYKNKDGMSCLAHYYEGIEKNYPGAIKYYKMAIDYGSVCAMNNLGWLYYRVEKNSLKAKKYLSMAISHGCKNALYYMSRIFSLTEIYLELKKLEKNKLIEEKLQELEKLDCIKDLIK